ncbi:TerB family tellurite resistance protein [Paraburkholderia aromaticivorans]|uniref:TerB family tellurite resistance protein n=1 Tax=Paraburkholderia aromaticivorans TaxID=2026199 RepID=UPI001455E1EF|nr:TerB family tellurite resistance protein [Paraburkholderia aromaticivorans]
MRHYQCNSPEAAGRILAACLLIDGHLSLTELDALDRCGMERRLLLNRYRLLSIVQTLYEDLTRSGYLSWSDICQVDPTTLAWLAADVQDRRLRRDIMELCSEAVMADRGHCDREAEFLRLLRDAWQLPARPVRQVALAGTSAS